MDRAVRYSLGTFVILATLLAGARPAAAYPQWQLSAASRCNQCHLAPSGGGPLTGYGRDAVGEELSTIEGSGAFLHGAIELPPRIAIGGDLRGALLAQDVQSPDGPTLAAFPMQAELNLWVRAIGDIYVYGSAGLRGQMRDEDTVVPTQNYQPVSTSRLISREHYVLWQPGKLGPYARAGRFYAPFGLRLAEHVLYVRRDLGFNLLEESYNVSGGFVANEWELHLTAFMPDVFREMGGRESGGAAYLERRLLNDTALAGAQLRLAFGDGMNRLVAGGVGKYHLAVLRTLFLGEINLVRQMFDASTVGVRHQLVATAGFALLPVRGLTVTLLGERNHEDITVSGAGWNAASALLNWFPYPHVELQLIGRLQFPTSGQSAKTFLGQLHYFL